MLRKILYTIALGVFIPALFLSMGSKASASVANWQTGATIGPRWNTDFSSDTFKQSLQNLAATHANYVTLVVPYYQSNIYSTDIAPGWNTPDDATLISAISYAHSLGLKVMLKPHVDTYDGQWRANINPSDRNGWFAAYGGILNHLATLAQANGVEQLCVGAELIDMSTSTANGNNTAAWNTLISNVRSRFSGPLTYSANWGGGWFGDEKDHIDFWGSLDYIGISAYFNLNTGGDVNSLKAAWDSYNNNEIRPLSVKFGKPVLFTEIGYKSVDGAHYEPWNSGRGGGYNGTEQANDYTALFDYWNGQNFMQGVQLWDWSSDPNAGWPGNIDYTPQHKPAQDVMTQWFSGSVTSTPGPNPGPTVTCPGPATNSFTACYFSDKTLTTPKVTRTDNAINFDWGMGSPDPAIPVDGFSARWEGNFTFQSGDYTFTTTADDGVRVYIDNQLVLDKWIDQPATTYTVTKTMTAGTHTIKMEYYEDGGNAVAKLSWAQSGGTATTGGTPAASCGAAGNNNFTACYYNDKNFTNLYVSRPENSINYDWGTGAPIAGMNSDNFSVVWQGNFQFNAAAYTFTMTTDDGATLYIDDQPVIDKFFDQPATTYTVTKAMTAGSHMVKLIYYENGGNAVAKLSWTEGGTIVTPPPPSGGGGGTTGGSTTTITYINGYPTVNGNYIDCNGNVDNDMGHHTTNPSDTDPAHHVGQNCPSGSYVATHSP